MRTWDEALAATRSVLCVCVAAQPVPCHQHTQLLSLARLLPHYALHLRRWSNGAVRWLHTCESTKPCLWSPWANNVYSRAAQQLGTAEQASTVMWLI